MAAVTPAYGHEEGMALVAEASYGAGGTPTTFIRPVSFTLKRKDPPLPLRQATGGAVAHAYDASNPRHFRGTPDVSGTIEIEAEYDDIGWFLGAAFKDASTADANPIYTHTFTLDATHPSAMPTSLAIARVTGVEDLLFTGCLVDNLEISGSAGQIVSFSMDIIGQAGGDSAVDDTMAGLSDAPFIEFHQSEFAINSVGTASGSLTAERDNGKEPVDWTFRLENGLRAVQGVGVQVSAANIRGIRPPVYTGQRRATLTINRDFVNDDFFDFLFPATEPAAYTALHIKSTSEAFISGGTPFDLDIYMPAALVVSDPSEYGGGADIVPETITFEAADHNGSAAPCTVTLVNGTAAY